MKELLDTLLEAHKDLFTPEEDPFRGSEEVLKKYEDQIRIGPGGPTEEQTKANTLLLQAAIKELTGVTLPYVRNDWLSQALEEEAYGLHIVGEVYVGFDRWGYVVDGMEELELDQATLAEAVKFVMRLMETGYED